MGSIVDKIIGKKVSRRDFLKGSVAATAAVGALSMTGCSSNKVSYAYDKDQYNVPDSYDEKDGTWIAASCWHNCGGRCVNKALVIDGVVVRQKTDDTHEDTADYPQQRGCLRGRSQRKQVFAPDRLKYPMKRKNWKPGGGKKELRGKDEWVPITWEEALDIVASEIKRISEEHGNRSIVAVGAEIERALALHGGYTSLWGTTSFGSWLNTPNLLGFEYYYAAANDRMDFRNSENIIMFGLNPAWSSGGNPTSYYMQAKKNGAKFFSVDPIYTDTAATMEADWTTIRPGTDTAFLLGVAYILITEDSESNPRIDWDILNRCTVGFDENNMPEGADKKDNFKDYVLGTYDNTPKTPEWASEICGASAQQIRTIADALDIKKKVAILFSWAVGRTNNSSSLPQIAMTIGAMTGHIGKSGHMCGIYNSQMAGNSGEFLVMGGKSGLEPIANPVDDCMNLSEIWPSINAGQYNYTGNGITADYKPVEKRDLDVKMIYHGAMALLQTSQGTIEGIKAHRKVDFVVSNAQFMTTNAKYSDIVLPVTTMWEREGDIPMANRETLLLWSNVVEPMYEGKSDQWIATEIAKRLGSTEEEIYPVSEKQQYFNKIAGAIMMSEDGKTPMKVATITQEDIEEMGVVGTPQQGYIPLKEWKEKGKVQIKRSPNDKFGFIAYEQFVKDPAKNPRKYAKTGKMEICSPTYAAVINAMGFSKIKPYPEYTAAIEGYEETFKDWKNKVKGDYPYQVINPHYLRRSHTVFHNIPWLREAWQNPVFISASDAADKGVKSGDTVLLKSKHGKVIRIACVIERIMPGVIGLPHGAWIDLDEKTGIDKAGADNTLVGAMTTGAGVSGYNSCLVDFEKYDGEALEADHKQPTPNYLWEGEV